MLCNKGIGGKPVAVFRIIICIHCLCHDHKEISWADILPAFIFISNKARSAVVKQNWQLFFDILIGIGTKIYILRKGVSMAFKFVVAHDAPA